MPEGVGYEVWTDQNPPQGDDPILQEGFLWEHPSAGKVRYDPKSGGYIPVSDEEWAAKARQPAAEQAGAIEGLGGGVTAAETAGPSGGRRETRREQRERGTREEAAAGVAAAEAQERSAGEGVYGGLSLPERAAATQLVAEGMTEEEAVMAVMSVREQGAAEQAGAIE